MRAWAIVGAALMLAACGGPRAAASVPAAAPQAAALPQTSIPHGDHNPRFGGVVYMNGDLHFEVVLGRDGRHRVYFSDAIRNELPAATASNVAITVTRKGNPPEDVRLAIDESGEAWVGQGHRIDDPNASARVSYAVRGTPFFIDVPVPK